MSIRSEADVPTAQVPLEITRFYKMNHRSRGLALIFNHVTFTATTEKGAHLADRDGTNKDCMDISECLRVIGFRVKAYHNLTYRGILKKIQKAADKNHSDVDCIAVIVLTHGELGRVYAEDCSYKLESLFHPFTNENCKTLAGKPKLFFVQACQGEGCDGGIMMIETDPGTGTTPNETSNMECADEEDVTVTKMPTPTGHCKGCRSNSYDLSVPSDFLVARSTIPGFYSWRSKVDGSWFIQALCRELREKWSDWDLLTILTFVMRRVATDYESNVPLDPEMHEQKQIPYVTWKLTKLVKFTKKQHSRCSFA